MVATITQVQPPSTGHGVALFSGRAVTWLGLIFGFPAVLLLLACNWHQVGARIKAVRYVIAAALCLVALPVAALVLPSGIRPWLLIPIDIFALIFLVPTVADVEEVVARSGDRLVYRDARLAVAIGVLAALVLMGVGAALRTALTDEYHVVGLDGRDGRALWVTPIGPDRTLEPLATTAANGRLFVYAVIPADQRYRLPGKTLVALDAATGRQLWHVALDRLRDDPDPYRAIHTERKLFADADTLYVQMLNDIGGLDLRAFDANTGTPRWSVSLQEQQPYLRAAYAQVARQGDELIVLTETLAGSSRNFTTALEGLDRRTGVVGWSVPLPDADPEGRLLGPVAGGGMIVVGLAPGRVAAFAPHTGQRLWSSGTAAPPVALVGPNLYGEAAPAPTGDPRVLRDLVASDPATGQQRWTLRFGQVSSDSYLLDQDGAYVPLEERDAQNRPVEWLVAVGAADGRERWRVPLISSFDTPIANQDTILVEARWSSGVGSKGQQRGLIAYARADGTERWRLPLDVRALTADSGHVQVVGSAPRWRDWLARINPAWH